jgi:hypothetical protein
VGVDGDGWKLAAALAAKNVGGGLNYVAVATTLGVSPPAFAAGITADNFFALVYFPIVSWLGGPPRDGVGDDGHDARSDGDIKEDEDAVQKDDGGDDDSRRGVVLEGSSVEGGDVDDAAAARLSGVGAAPAASAPPSVGELTTALALSCFMVTAARHIAPPSLGALPTATALGGAVHVDSPWPIPERRHPGFNPC